MKKAIGTRFIVCICVGVISLITTGHAAYIIDADLSDWNIPALGDWIPGSTTTNSQTNKSCSCGYDVEGEIGKSELFYHDEDDKNIYLVVVSSYPSEPKVQGLNLGLELNTGSTVYIDCPWIGPEQAPEISTGQIDCTTISLISLVETDYTMDCDHSDENQQDSLDQEDTDIPANMAQVAIKGYPNLEYGTIIVIEIAVPKSVLPCFAADSFVAYHLDQYCGNELINLNCIVAVPETGTVALVSLGMVFLRMFRTWSVRSRKKNGKKEE